ncbi:Maf family protein [Candidatus Nitrospira bockiana]
MRLILASTSPRRRELLALLGLPFDTLDPRFVEVTRPEVPPRDHAMAFAEGKARSAAEAVSAEAAVIIGCDTLIEIDGAVIGKPVDAAEARRMLRRLSGRRHVVHTGVAVVSTATGACRRGVESVRIRVASLRDDQIERYVASGEPLDKAGAYAIQGAGAELIAGIEGDYTAAVGLPLRLLAALLEAHHVAVPVDVDALYREKPYRNWSRFA